MFRSSTKQKKGMYPPAAFYMDRESEVIKLRRPQIIVVLSQTAARKTYRGMQTASLSSTPMRLCLAVLAGLIPSIYGSRQRRRLQASGSQNLYLL